jgi:uncharacterized protein (DUF305 family)
MKRYIPACRTTVAGTALIAALALPACTGAGSNSAVPAKSNGGASSRSSAVFNNVDVMFTQMMIMHHQQAVEMANLAQTRAADPKVKQLAAQIKAEQTPEIATMKGWLAAWGQPTAMPGMPSGMPSGMPGMPSGMPSGMPGMMSSADMAKLAAATGKNFDKQFLQMMIAHHKGAIQMAHAEQVREANPDAKTLASQIIKSQQAEIGTMQKMLAQM